ncbi:DUF3870 domain-containing protein [Desulfosporosinus sp. BICA1-9]|uniref:DUF3870 domain-containing protein n=1 Tax=Desulfosporosinus sp. BICA1-9 TaxID=1531958 RepID=UPI00054BE3D5|nr:DUF3870 domain-containing protein [Desulfosporosinus sp. BICA1-9]KJS46082.1 MAG: hypothetical protein VR66_27285 [Peptococcaceae bacterium BRH_c23]KJS88545.1 MAG: hypothetical protein JL57_12065 [Desulfosporosinus sp. BICA1-9]
MDEQYPPKSVLVAGYAQVPKGSANYEQHKVIVVTLVVDLETSIIVDAGVNIDWDVINKFLRSKAIGLQLDNGIEGYVQSIRSMASFSAIESFIQAFKICYERYIEIASKNKTIKQV